MASTSSAAAAPPVEQPSSEPRAVPQGSTTEPQSATQSTDVAPAAADSAVESGVPRQTYRNKLDTGDGHWMWKLAQRVLLIIVGLIGIGCAAAITAKSVGSIYNDYSYYDFGDTTTIPFTLITFAVSVIWSFVCILVFLLRRNKGPVHPGAQVGVDLVLWLAFCVTAAAAVIAVINVTNWGAYGVISNYSGSGEFQYVQSNNSWAYYNNSDTNSYYSGENCFGIYNTEDVQSTCEEVANTITEIWRGRTLRLNLDLTVTVCQFISLILHFSLFVWACVDTHRRNSTRNNRHAEALANEIIEKMIASGAMVPASAHGQTGTIHTQPMVQQSMQSKGKGAAPRYL